MTIEENNAKSKLTFTTNGAWLGLIAYLFLTAVITIIIIFG